MVHENDQIAMLTGAAGVVGQATARMLVKNGYRVIMVDLDEEKLDYLAHELGSRAHPMVMDISRSEQVVQSCEMIRRDIGSVSILINNAGVLSNNKLTETDNDEWHRILAVNLDGAFYLSREWLPGMKARKWGRIINVCSLAMKTGGLTAGTAYAASKGALGALTFSIAREAALFGVTVNGIAPAYIKTPMVTDFLSEEKQRQVTEQIPVGRFCEAEEVAHVVLFLMSPLSGFITGEIIDVNGGLQMD
jgi:3-oxoacyl-[acyl-carrier protein] reductase